MERVSVARMATAEPQGWVYASRGMGVPRPAAQELNRYNFSWCKLGFELRMSSKPQPYLERWSGVINVN
jgi:hypothetical protein